LYVKDKEKLYNKQTAVLIHEFGHILDHTVRMIVPIRPPETPAEIPTDYGLEIRAWETGERHFRAMGLIPKGFKSFRNKCLATFPRSEDEETLMPKDLHPVPPTAILVE